MLSGESWHRDVSEMCCSPSLTQVPSPKLAQRLTQEHSQPGWPRGPQGALSNNGATSQDPAAGGCCWPLCQCRRIFFPFLGKKTPGGLPQACKREGYMLSRSRAQKAGDIPPTSCQPHVFPAALGAGGPRKEGASPTSLRAALTFPCVLPAPSVTAGHGMVPAGSWRGEGGGGNAGRS